MTDDIFVFGKDETEQTENLYAVAERLEKNGITLNVDKCEFFKTDIEFYGLRFTTDGVAPKSSRFQALKEASPPSNSCVELYIAQDLYQRLAQ